MKKTILIVVVTFCILSLIALSGCSSSNSSNPLVGSYRGSLGSKLTINGDGTCNYYDAAWLQTENGTWKSENNILTLYDVADSELTADISEFDNTNEFILKGNGSEKFTKKTTVD